MQVKIKLDRCRGDAERGGQCYIILGTTIYYKTSLLESIFFVFNNTFVLFYVITIR